MATPSPRSDCSDPEQSCLTVRSTESLPAGDLPASHTFHKETKTRFKGYICRREMTTFGEGRVVGSSVTNLPAVEEPEDTQTLGRRMDDECALRTAPTRCAHQAPTWQRMRRQNQTVKPQELIRLSLPTTSRQTGIHHTERDRLTCCAGGQKFSLLFQNTLRAKKKMMVTMRTARKTAKAARMSVTSQTHKLNTVETKMMPC